MGYNTEIVVGNFSEAHIPRSIQYTWGSWVIAGGRPPVDLNISIVCATSLSWNSTVSNQFIFNYGEDFDWLSPCCPRNGVATHVWRMDAYDGGRKFCFTDNTTIASNFDQCVQETMIVMAKNATATGRVPSNSALQEGKYGGRCEYVDYERVKKGIVKSRAQRETVGMKMLLGVSALGFVAATAGMF